MSRSASVLLVLHVMIWVALAAAAYATAGPYTFANCWTIILLYSWPVAALFLAIAGISLLILLISIVRPALPADLIFSLGCHGMVLTLGWIGSRMAAHAAAGPVSCL